MPHRRHEDRQHEGQRQRVEGVEERGAAHDDAGAQVPARERHALESRDERRGRGRRHSRAAFGGADSQRAKLARQSASGCSMGVRCRARGRTVSVDCGIASCSCARHLDRRRVVLLADDDCDGHAKCREIGAHVRVAQQLARRGIAVDVARDEHVERPFQHLGMAGAELVGEPARGLEFEERGHALGPAPRPPVP